VRVALANALGASRCGPKASSLRAPEAVAVQRTHQNTNGHFHWHCCLCCSAPPRCTLHQVHVKRSDNAHVAAAAAGSTAGFRGDQSGGQLQGAAFAPLFRSTLKPGRTTNQSSIPSVQIPLSFLEGGLRRVYQCSCWPYLLIILQWRYVPAPASGSPVHTPSHATPVGGGRGSGAHLPGG
jgi:hypothetical protein